MSLLQKEEDFYDVTLVSEDQTQIKAHKVVLSACSPFFKNILKKNLHQHPLLYLDGISSSHLQLITDYIYHGEVQVCQNEIDGFLEIAQKLKVSGLDQAGKFENKTFTEHHDFNDTNKETFEIDSKFIVTQSKSDSMRQFSNFAISITDMNELDDKIAELTGFQDGLYFCKSCGKTFKGKINITRHVEVHIEGISLPCQDCGKEFRSRYGLQRHKCNAPF